MQNQNKINSANFCCLASFEKNIEPIQRATVIVYHARERRPREERQIPFPKENWTTCMFLCSL